MSRGGYGFGPREPLLERNRSIAVESIHGSVTGVAHGGGVRPRKRRRV